MKNNININRPQLTSSDIKKGKDFDTLLKNYNKAIKPFYKTRFFISSLVLVAVVALVTAYYLNQPHIAKQNKPYTITIKANSTLSATSTVKPQVQDSVRPYTPSSLATRVNAPGKSTISSLITSSSKTMDTTSLLSIYRQFDKIPQVFTISSNKDTIITCAEGTKIKITAHSFLNEKTDAEINGTIQVKVKEYYKLSDILLAKLSTMCDSNLLETGGMVHIATFANDNVCVLKASKPIEISFPAEEKKADMQLFSGTWTDNYKINWKLDSDKSDIMAVVKLPKAVSVTMSSMNKIYSFVDTMPVFSSRPYYSLEGYLFKNIRYPKDAIAKRIEGTVYVAFVVYANGQVGNVRIVRGVCGSLDSSAIKLVRSIPRFERPGKQNSQPVNVQMVLPVKFSLNSANRNNESDYITTDTVSRYQPDSVAVLNQGSTELSYYIFSTSRLGWINCDRFENNTKSRVDYIVNCNKNDDNNVNIIFHQYKAIMNGNKYSNFYSFRVPDNERITIVAIKYENGKPYLAIKESKTSAKPENDLVYQPITIEFLKAEMEKMDRLN